MKPRVWVFSVFRNEERLLPYFMRHYSRFADKILLWDDHSTDGSRAILAEYPMAEVRSFEWEGGFDDIYLVQFANLAYKEARGQADWCIWVDADEFVYHHGLLTELQKHQAAGDTVLDFGGYQMFAEAPPSGPGQIYAELHRGQAGYGKAACVFSPELLEVNWWVGKHTCKPAGRVQYSEKCDLVLLHYRCLGVDYLLSRNAANYGRMSDRNRVLGLGIHTFPVYWSKVLAEYEAGQRAAVDIFRPVDSSQAPRPAVRPAPETLLSLLLGADDIAAALTDYAAWLDAALRDLVLANAGAARDSGDAELADGLDSLAAYVEGVLAARLRL